MSQPSLHCDVWRPRAPRRAPTLTIDDYKTRDSKLSTLFAFDFSPSFALEIFLDCHADTLATADGDAHDAEVRERRRRQ